MAFFGANLDNFLDTFWQMEPYQLAGVLPDVDQLISADEVVFAASTEQAASTLLIMSKDGPWELKTGPFETEQIEALTQPYDLSVRGLEKMMPELKSVGEQLHFLPNWGREELSFSFSDLRSARGPYLNESDSFFFIVGSSVVFEYARTPTVEIKPDLPIDVVANFLPIHKIELTKGDLLYLPPGFSYRFEGSMIMSISSHAPLRSELLADWLTACPTNPRLQVQASPHNGSRVTPDDVERARNFLKEAMGDPEFGTWFGRYLTATGAKLVEPVEPPVNVRQFKAELNHSEHLYRSPNVSWAYYESDDPLLFVNGRAFPAPLQVARMLAENDSYDIESLKGEESLLCDLYNLGYIDFFPLEVS